MYKILNYYLRHICYHYILLVLTILMLISFVMKLMEQLSKIILYGDDYFIRVLCIILHSIPKDIEIFLPIAVLLGTIISIGELSLNNELIIIQIYGISRLRIIIILLWNIIPLLLLIIMICENIIPILEKFSYCNNINNQNFSNNTNVYKHVWIKENENIIFFEKILNNRIQGIYIYKFLNKNQLKCIYYAENAVFYKKIWYLVHLKSFNLYLQNKKIIKYSVLCSKWNTNLNPQTLNIYICNPSILSIYKLYKYLQYLKKNDQNYRIYEIYIWKKLFYPFFIFFVQFIGIVCALGPLKNKNKSLRIIVGIFIGLILYLINHILQVCVSIFNIIPVFGMLVFYFIIFIFIIIILFFKNY